jgi:hypothetical protein
MPLAAQAKQQAVLDEVLVVGGEQEAWDDD